MRQVVAALCAAGLVLGACGGNGGSDRVDDAAPATTASGGPASTAARPASAGHAPAAPAPTAPAPAGPAPAGPAPAGSAASTTGTAAARPTATTTRRAPATTAPAASTSTTTAPGPVRLAVTEVARGLDTVWSLAWDPQGRLHFTERGGRITRLGDAPQQIVGVRENGEAGLMGLAIDGRGRRFVMYTSATDNRVVRLEDDGRQTVLAQGIAAASVHDGGRLAFGPDGRLYATTGDAGQQATAQSDASPNGKVLRIDPDGGGVETFSKGHRNPQGLCFNRAGRLYSTEHGPDRGDEVNILTKGFNGGWPETSGNGIANWTPTIAPAGCAVYEAALIPQWRGSLLFVTLKDQSVRRLVLSADGTRVVGQERLYAGDFGRLRDLAVGPDGAVYLATSNRDGRGSPRDGDDRILRIAPA